MVPMPPLREQEAANYEFFLSIPDPCRTDVKMDLKGSQFLQPLFEYSGACAGCGETPYIKLMTQLFGDRALIANATGCSSIYGGNLPTTPYTVDRRRPRPGLVELAVRGQRRVRLRHAARPRQPRGSRRLSSSRAPTAPLGDNLVKAILEADQSNEAGIAAQRERVAALKQALAGVKTQRGAAAAAARRLPRAQERLDRRRRRLGLRHRLRRPRPRAVDHPRRQRPGPRHRGLLEHRRPGLEGHADRRLRQVRLGRQGGRARRTSA